MIDIPGGTFTREYWETEIRNKYLRGGYSVLLSIHGHIVRLEAVTDLGLVVDDPYGASVLKAGTARGWNGSNKRLEDGTSEGNVGEDHGYPWADVEKSSFKYMRAFL